MHTYTNLYLAHPLVNTRFLSELRKITDQYDTRTSVEEVEAVKILTEKINVVNVLNC